MKRWSAFAIAIILAVSFPISVLACDENQTNTYASQIIFGDSAQSKVSDENAKVLLDALYICSEQSDGIGQDKLNNLKTKKVSGVPALTKIDIKGSSLLECSHNSWEYTFSLDSKKQSSRRKILQNTVNKVFDFGTLNNLFGSDSGKCNSFAALLYYSHILSDYLADDPSETQITFNGKSAAAYSGQAYAYLNGNKPEFTAQQKKNTEAFVRFSSLDSMGRCGVAFGNIGPEIMPPPNSRQDIGSIKPAGWNQQKYPGIVNSDPPYLYNRCHLIAHQLAGEDGEINLITGTRYLNETGMKPFEDDVAQYIKMTGNHVLYRATPIYDGDNKIASGVQIEGYSVEDAGKGICFNVYCYNVQPGVDINYQNGENSGSDVTFQEENILPFATLNASEDNPDLIYEMNKHLEILFDDQKNTNTFTSMIDQINSIANEARVVGDRGENPAQCYIKLKGLEYEYFEVLKNYVPLLLQKEEFFKSAFGN